LVTDVWAELQKIFGVRVDNLYPGIQINGLDRHTQETILQHICKSVRELDPVLNDLETGIELYPTTIDEMIDYLLSDKVDGMIWIETYIDGYPLPQIGFFASSTSSLTIHYMMGMWTPVSVIGLFELLRWINDLGDPISIRMEQDTAPRSFCKQFDKTWQAYLNDKRC
jgi:hypothetical protein